MTSHDIGHYRLWIAPTKRLDRDEALAELTRRYFVGHGPATLQDFVWWTSLKVSDANSR
jgi:hypothetical protein